MAQKILTLSAGGILTEINDAYQGTVTSVGALTLGTTGTDLSSSVATGTTTPVITLNVPTASASNRGALSSADWSTFNGKQSGLGYTPINKAGDTGVGDLGMGRLTASGGTFNGTIAAGNYSVQIAGATGAARDILLAGQAGVSNGFTVQYNGTNMVYSMSNGSLTVGGAVQSTTHKVTSAAGYISSDGSTGYTGTVTTASLVGKTLTIKDGIITGFA